MKRKPIILSISVVCLLLLQMFTACQKTEKKLSFGSTDTCDCCKSYGGITKKVVNGDTLTFYSAITPSNLMFCDSNVFVNGILSSKGCKRNMDSVYNDNINSHFIIGGLDSFPQNDLIFRVLGDSTRIYHFVNYKNKSYYGFFGVRIDTTLYGNSRQRQLAQGRYEYILKLYKKDSYYHDKTTFIDSISGFFCIIRNLNINSKGCVGADANDPLIQK